MNPENESIFCTNCGVEIAWLPVIKDRRPYCCQDCIRYLACKCAGVFEIEEDRLTGQRPVIELPAEYQG